jgi:progesterone-induced-blocking factor 1
MAARDLSKTFDDVESDDPSLETSVPTDLTMSPDQSEKEGGRNKKRQITKQLIEKKQLTHDLQLLKIELSQKNMTIENLKVEHLQRVEELEEKLHEVTHQKQILQARLESELQIQQDEAKKRQHQISRELEMVQTKQQHLEAANERLREKAGDVRRSLRDLGLTEERFYQLKGLPEDELSLRDYVAVSGDFICAGKRKLCDCALLDSVDLDDALLKFLWKNAAYPCILLPELLKYIFCLIY